MNSRAKGKRGELAWRDILRDYGWLEARRGQQYSGTETSEDVVGGPTWTHAEVKVRERHDFWDAMEQAERDAAGRAVPYVAAKRNRRPWLVALRAEDFLRLAKLVDVAKLYAQSQTQQEWLERDRALRDAADQIS